MMADANIRKARGSTDSVLMQILLAGSFCEGSIWQRSGKQVEGPCRDAFYRFLGKELSCNQAPVMSAIRF